MQQIPRETPFLSPPTPMVSFAMPDSAPVFRFAHVSSGCDTSWTMMH